MRTAGVREARQNLSALLDEVRKGREVVITERGRPSVKIGSSEPASGLSFAGPTGTKDTYLILQSKGTTSFLKLRNGDGREHVLSP